MYYWWPYSTDDVEVDTILQSVLEYLGNRLELENQLMTTTQ